MSGKLGFFSCKHKKFFLWVENWFFEVDVKNFFVWTFFLYDGVKYMTFFGQIFLFGKGQVNVPSDRFFQTGMKNIFLWKISFLGKHINFCFFLVGCVSVPGKFISNYWKIAKKSECQLHRENILRMSTLGS